MYSTKQYIVFFIFCALLFSCRGKQHLEQTTIDSALWAEDIKTCGDYRNTVVEQIAEVNKTLSGLRESEVMDILGKPYQILLHNRNEKFFEYKLRCDSLYEDQNLRIRFNALGYANESLVVKKEN
ncbi:hypothetical protein N6H18_13545 [Reichenbachiella agarivorans]|uniref:Lipoprotein n=1 Tax=Reichenbachiella agarivorans TaxID=2979464 RepID=A0ABY6CLI3_9BACT|nr:hypothetical protein [Reichenbachiella agarivorans]UXP31374.1 hypothetical protein N6H18_13545 [Reichenbachiella agarivorans]